MKDRGAKLLHALQVTVIMLLHILKVALAYKIRYSHNCKEGASLLACRRDACEIQASLLMSTPRELEHEYRDY